jgi:hypothetical protein
LPNSGAATQQNSRIFRNTAVLIKRPIPVQTFLDYADTRLKMFLNQKNEHRLLDKQKTHEAMNATFIAADEFNLKFEARDDVAVMHDLRIFNEGASAHIDHLFITNTLQVFIVESRLAIKQLDLHEDHRCTSHGEQMETCEIPSPIEQLKRNRQVLKKAFKKIGLPTRFGKVLAPSLHCFVALDAYSLLSNQLGRSHEYFVSPEQLNALIDQHCSGNRRTDFLAHFFTRLPAKELKRFASKLARLHTTKDIRFSNKFRHILTAPAAQDRS